MRDIALLVFVIGMLFFILKRPFIGILMWCWVSYMVPHKLGWGFMFSFPLAQIIALTFLFSYVISKEPKMIKWRAPIVILILFNLWLVLTFLAHPFTDHAVLQLSSFAKIQLFTLLTYLLLTNKERLNQVLLVVSLSIIFYGVKGGIATLTSGGSTRIWGPPGGFFEGNNELGLTLLIAMPIVYYFSVITENKWLKLGLLGAILLAATSVLGTQSRGALVAIACCGFFFWLKSNSKVITLLALIALAPVGYNFMPQSWHERMSTIVLSSEEEYDGSVQGRFNAWRMSFNLANDKVMGGGFDSYTTTNFYLYSPRPEMIHDAHSIYFKILGQHGYIGLILFLSLWLSVWLMASKIHRRCKHNEQLKWASLLARMLQISLVAYGAGGAFLGLAYFDLPYHIAVCIVALYNIVLKEEQAMATVSSKEDNDEAQPLAPGQRAPVKYQTTT